MLFAALAITACGDDDDPVPSPQPEPTPTSETVTLSAPVVTDVTATTAVVAAKISTTSSVKSKGFCYSTSPTPTTSDNTLTAAIFDMKATLSGLTAATTYYVRAYATTNLSTYYSEQVTFTTEAGSGDPLADYTAPTYADDYRTFAGWDSRAKWNLSNVHDPTVMLAEDGYYYMYQTDAGFGNPQAGHGHFHCRRSKNLVDWEYLGATMPSLPTWVKTKLNDIRADMGLGASTANFNNCGYWAPCARMVRKGLYRMYYVITIDGTINGDNTWGERAFIGLMETATPSDVNSWQDKGYVITNYSDRNLNYTVGTGNYWEQCYFRYNAIDPSYIITPEGQHWLVYGSWHSGFAAVQLNAETGKPITDPLPHPWGTAIDANATAYGKRIYTRSATTRWQASEAPEVVYHDGYYYLFMAYDALEVPYNTRVMRSEKIDGPYYGINGANGTNGADAFPILTHPYKFGSDHGWVGISHCAVFDDGNGNWFYASQGRYPENYDSWVPNAIMVGHVRTIRWTEDGWPLVMPERYGAVPQTAITEAEIAGTWEHITITYDYGKQNASQTFTLGADGKVTGSVFRNQTWSFDATKNIITIGAIKLYVQREVDWEANPRHATIVYAGLSADGKQTYWGKKGEV